MSLVAVFGGSGFIGRHLIRRLAARGDIIRAVGRDTEAAMFLKTMGEPGQIVPFQADITRPEQAAAATAGADAVVNLVGILSQWGQRTFRSVHAEGARNVARAAKDSGAGRLVQVSAIGAEKVSESEYARTKAAAEDAAIDAFPEATIVRPSVVFGPEDEFFNLFAGLARVSPVLPVFGCPVLPKVTLFGANGPLRVDIYGDGGTKFQPVYVGDVADAILAILENPGHPVQELRARRAPDLQLQGSHGTGAGRDRAAAPAPAHPLRRCRDRGLVPGKMAAAPVDPRPGEAPETGQRGRHRRPYPAGLRRGTDGGGNHPAHLSRALSAAREPGPEPGPRVDLERRQAGRALRLQPSAAVQLAGGLGDDLAVLPQENRAPDGALDVHAAAVVFILLAAHEIEARSTCPRPG